MPGEYPGATEHHRCTESVTEKKTIRCVRIKVKRQV